MQVHETGAGPTQAWLGMTRAGPKGMAESVLKR